MIMTKLNSKEQEYVNSAYKNGSKDFSEKDLNRVIEDKKTAWEKASKHFDQLFEEFKLLWQLLIDYKSGKYRDVPWKFIAAVGFSFAYLIWPIDVIPDFIPIVGYIDDVAVFGLVLAGFKSEIETYKIWKESQ